jgi:hypothetical protein
VQVKDQKGHRLMAVASFFVGIERAGKLCYN